MKNSPSTGGKLVRALIISLLWVITLNIFPFKNFLIFLQTDLYHPGHNFFHFPVLYEIPFLIWVYLLILIVDLSVRLINQIFSRTKRDTISITIISSFLILTIFQTMQQHQFLLLDHSLLSGKDQNERKEIIFQETYKFTQFCLKHVDPDQQLKGRLLTDFEWMNLEPSIVRYFLYPQIDLITLGHPDDCLVIYNKTKAENFVPKEFKTIKKYNDSNLLAIHTP